MQKHELKNTMEIRATPASVADAGKVRLGGESPSFGPVRAAPAITADTARFGRAARARALARSAPASVNWFSHSA
jgi:hypothetical protein